jgi:sec-independent protein translocase protein TatA
MLGNLGGAHLLIILAIVLLVFGAAKLPALAKALGQSTKILKSELKAPDGDQPPGASDGAVDASATPSQREK